MGVVRAGGLFLAIVLTAVFFGFTKENPFSNPYEMKLAFKSSMNLKPWTSQVRIAGIEVGRVTKTEPLYGRNTGALVTVHIERSGLPVHEDASAKIRQQLFLEGNYFVDLKPGSPSAPPLKDGGTIPMQQTAIPVQFGDVLTALQSDTREDLRTAASEYGLISLNGGGAQGINRSIQYWEPAYKSASLVNDALLGTRPGDVHRLLGGQQRTLAALVDNEGALKDLITNFNITAGALAREDDSLRAAIPALRDVLTVGPPALRDLSSAFPSVRRFARDALPGIRSSRPTLDALIPFVRQLRLLMQPAELRGLVADLRPTVPALARLNQRAVPILGESRAAAACGNNVLIPFSEDRIPNPDESWNTNQQVMRQLPRSLVGLAGESRISDANTPMFRVNFSGGNQLVFFGEPPAGGGAIAGMPSAPSGVRPATPRHQPDHRPDVPCETQEPPNLAAPGGRGPSFRPPSRNNPPAPIPISVLQEIASALESPETRVRREKPAAAQEGSGSRRDKGASSQTPPRSLREAMERLVERERQREQGAGGDRP